MKGIIENGIPLTRKRLDDIRADEPRSTGNQKFHHSSDRLVKTERVKKKFE